jgi:triosephosphate isomerase
MTPLVIGNWKMHLTISASVSYLGELLPLLPAREDREIALAPSFTALQAVASLLKGSRVRLAAQDVFWEDLGAYTGEISPVMLQEIGVTYVLIGHSERRQHLREDDPMIVRKVRAALRTGLGPVVCVGEQQEARSSGRAASVVRGQVLAALEEVPAEHAHRLVVAYEPVWAIGSGLSASPEDAQEIHATIRAALVGLFGAAGETIRILYGGSVTPENVDAFMARPGIDGVLAGGASLRALEFARIAAFLPRGD